MFGRMKLWLTRLAPLWLLILFVSSCSKHYATPSDAASNQGVSLYLSGNYAEAIKQFDQAILLNPTNADLYVNRGMAKVWAQGLQRGH